MMKRDEQKQREAEHKPNLADEFAIAHTLVERHPHAMGHEDDPVEPFANADNVYAVIREVWRPGMNNEEWLAAVEKMLGY